MHFSARRFYYLELETFFIISHGFFQCLILMKVLLSILESFFKMPKVFNRIVALKDYTKYTGINL